jgi:hypothetical protein
MTFPTPHIGNLKHGLFFHMMDSQSNAKPSEKDPGLEPSTFGLTVSIANENTI